MIIPGIIASRFTPQGDYESIATVLVGAGGQASAEFTSIPSTFQHLQIRILARSTAAGSGLSDCRIQFNSDTATNYNTHYLSGDGSTANAGAQTSVAQVRASGAMPNGGFLSNTFGVGVVDVLDYANTNKFKTIRSLSGVDSNNTSFGFMYFDSGAWRSTSAITSIKVFSSSGNLAQYSQIALYGIKG